MRSLVVVAGVPIDNVTMPESIDRIVAFVEEGRRVGRTHQVATINVDFVVSACTDPRVAAILQRADLAIPDGMPVVWASKMFGRPLRERVAGADLVPELAAVSAERGFSMMLFGSAPSVAESVATILRTRHPRLRVVGYGGPMFDRVTDMSDDVLDVIRSVAPDILCVALGHPKQEHWIETYRDKVDVPVLIGVGGSLDYIAGTKTRAPAWTHKLGLEWCHRLMTEPRRLGRRYARDLFRFAPAVTRQALEMRSRGAPRAPSTMRIGNTLVLQPVGALDLWIGGGAAALAETMLGSDSVVVDLSQVGRLDHATAASLTALRRECDRSGVPLSLVAPAPPVTRALARLRFDQTFTVLPEPGAGTRRRPSAAAVHGVRHEESVK
jgi:N-acetylglucosaminyldiphosphoundecaprenol N-acetyl-beta-D-mannosaminyltransferase